MANLQDLFNELQADDRIINPDTFEDFQSKMEDPDYAARVEDVLSRNGYDTNAYEGLKKKEESMDESVALSQSDSEQPSEVTDPTQTVGTEPVEEPLNINELDVNQFSTATQSPEIEMPISAVGVNPISDNQTQNVVEPIQNQVAPTQDDTDHPVSKITNLAKNLKKKLIDNPFIAMSKDIALGTAAFSMDEDEVENTLDAQEDVDTDKDKDKEPKDKKMKRKTANQISLETGLEFQTRSSAYDELEDTRIYGMKTNPEKGTVEFIWKKQNDPGSRGTLVEVPIDSATYREWVSNRIGGGMGFDDYNGNDQDWEDLKRATLTVSGYKPTIGGQEAVEDINLNYAAHLEKTKRDVSYVLPVLDLKKGEEKDRTFFEKVVDYTKGKISDVEAATIRANEYLKERARKRQEDIETYRIAEQTVQNTSYVTKADESFRNSPYNSSWTNDILEKYQIPISELLLDGNKEQILAKIEVDYLKDFNPKIMAGDSQAKGFGQELSPFAEETREEYTKKFNEAKRAEAERLYNMARRDAQFHLAELAIMNQIEAKNPKFRYEDVERLRKTKSLENASTSDYATGYEDQAGIHGLTKTAEENYSADINIANAKFARNMIEYANSEYTGYYKSLAGMSSMNLQEKGISNDARTLNSRKKELASKVEEAKKRNNVPDDSSIKNSVKGAKAVVTEMSAIDKQIAEKTKQYSEMLVEENGEKFFKTEEDLAVGEKLKAEVDALLQKREQVKLKMGEFSPVLDVVQKYSDETKDAYNEMTTIDSELSRFGADKDVKLLQDLSPTLELIESYDLNREMTIDPNTGRPYSWVTASRKNQGNLGEFTMLNTYEDNVETAEKIAAENDTWVEAFAKGGWGGIKSMGGGMLLTGEYLTSFVTPGESFLNDDPNTWTAVDNRKAMYGNQMERIARETVNPAYEEWGAKYIVGSVGSIAPCILATYLSGGSAAGFFEIAGAEGAAMAVGKTLFSKTTAYFTAQSVGNLTKEFEDAGYDPATALFAGSMLGAATSWMESLMPELPEFERLAMRSAVKKIIAEGVKKGLSPQQISKQLLNGFWKTTGKSIVNVANKGIIGEGFVEEGSQFIVEQGVMTAAGVRESEIIDPKTGEFGSTTKEYFKNVALGGIVGTLTTGGSVLKTLIQEKSTNLVGKQAQLAIATDFDYFVDQAVAEDDKFKESKTYAQIKNIKDRYDEMASNPKFQEFDEVAKGEILNANIGLTEMMNADKSLQTKGITDIKLQENIKESQDALNKLFEVSQERVDQRKELNDQLKELGVSKFQVGPDGKLVGVQFDEYTTTEDQTQNTPKVAELIEKTNTKTQENAIQEPGTGEVLQRQPQETGETGSERKGVEPVLEGEKPTKKGWKEKITEKISQLKELIASDDASIEETGAGKLAPEQKKEILNEIQTLEQKAQEAPQEEGKEEIIATPKEQKEPQAMQSDIDQVQQSTGTVINLNEDGTLTINAPKRGGQSKKDAAIENAKQELAKLGYNVESRVTQPVQEQTQQEEVQKEPTDEEFDTAIKETENMGIVAGSQSMNELQKRTAQDPKKGKIVAQASRAVKALKSLFPNMNIVIHESDESYNNAMNTLGGTVNSRGQFVYKPSADGNIQGAVHINLNRANARTIAHEVTHAALLKMFKGDGKVFSNFKDKLKDIAKDRKMIIKDKDGNEVETTWGAEAEKLAEKYTDEKGFTSEDRAEEYLSELAGLVAELDVNKPENKSILQKIAEFINNFILSNPQLKALGITPISDTSSAEEVLEFFETLGKKISRGETVDSGPFNELLESEPYSTSEAVEVDPNTFVAQPVQTKSQIGDYQVPNNIEILQTADLPVNTLEEKIKEYNGRVIMITSDATGYGVDKDGDPILGGPGFASNATNVEDGIGFASVSVGTVKSTYTLAEKSYGEGKVLVLIMVQNPHTTINNSYGSKYIIRGLSEIRKSSESEFKKTIDSIKDFINNSTSLKKEINKINKSITDLNTSVKEETGKLQDLQKQKKEKLAEIQKNKGDKKLSNKLEGNLKTIDKKILTKNEKIAASKEQIKELSEKRSRGSIENLIKFFSSIKKDSDIDALVEEYLLDTTFNVRKILGQGLIVKNKDVKPNKKTTYSKIALNNAGYNIYEFLKEYGDNTILDEDMMLNDKGGFLVGGFELDVLPAEERLALINDTQSRGIKHPLFNAKLPGTKHFRLDALYPVNQNFVRFAKPDKAINLNKEEIDKAVKKFFPGKNEYSELSAAEKTKIKNEYFGPKGLLVDKTPDVATKVAKGEGFVPQEGASEKLQKAKFKTKPGVKTKAQLDDDIETVFKDNPKLSTIGTVKEYADYLMNIFPKSLLKDIFYRGSSNPDRIEAEDIDPKKGTGAKNLGIGIYWTLNKKKAADYTNDGKGRIEAAVLDIRDFHATDIDANWNRSYTTPNKLTVSEITNGVPTILGYRGLDRDNHIEFKTEISNDVHVGKYVGPVDENGLPGYQKSNMMTPEFTELAVDSNAQVHILGSKKDVEGFKNFVAEKKTGVVAKAQIDIDAEESPLYQKRTKEDVPFVSNEQVQRDMPKMDVDTLKTEAKGIKIEPGMLVGARINLRATRIGYPVLSLHHTFQRGSKTRKENTKASSGEVIASRGNVTLSNVNFNVSQTAREDIAAGTDTKKVMAMAVGRVMDVEPNFDGIELSFNPAREHLFVDANGRAVKSAEEVTVMGFKAYARGKISYFEDFEDPRSPNYTAPSQVTFAKTKDELIRMADDVETGNTTVEEVGVPEVAPEVVAEAITAFSDAIENGSTIEEATEEVAIILENSTEEGPRKVTPPSEKTEPVSANKKEEKPKTEKKEKTEGPTLSDPETIVAFTIAGNAKSIMDVEGVTQSEAVNKAVLEMTNGDQESADKYLAQPGVKETIDNKIKQIKAKTARQLEADSNKVTISERKLILDRVKAEIKAALEGFKEGKQEGIDQAQEKAQKTIDALNKKLEEGKITKQELQDRIKELGYTIRWEAGVARLAGENAGKTMGKKFGAFIGYFRGLRAGRLEQKGLGAMVSDYIKEMIDNEFGKKGQISPATLKAISRRAATISNQKQLDAFINYLDKIIANRRLAEGINEIQKQQKKLLTQLGYQYTGKMKQFAKFDLYTADGDLAFDMNTLEKYMEALQSLNQKVPNISQMNNLFDYMYAIDQANMPADIDVIKEYEKWDKAADNLFNNTVINNFEDYKRFKSDLNKAIRAVNNLYEAGIITELELQSFLNKVIKQDSTYDKYASQFQDQIDMLKKSIVNGIVDKGTNSLWDSIKDWLTNAPNNFTRNQKKLIDQLQRAKADNLMTLSLDDIELLNQVVTQIAENGFVDEKNLRSILDRAEIRGEKIGEQIIAQSSKMSSKYKGPNAFMKMSLDVLNKAVVFWESRLGMKENGAFRKNVIDPITNAVNGWTEDTQRILKGYRDSVVKLKVKGKLKIKTTKFEKGKIVPTGKTRKVSKEAYRRVKIGVIGHILDNAWNAKQKKKNVNDWLGDQLGDNSTRNSMAEESVDELDIVQDIYNDLIKEFPDGNGGLDHMAVLEAFENPKLQSSVMSADELEYYDAVRSTLQEAGEYINSANAIRNKQHELNPYYMPRQSVGVGMSSVTSNDISYNQELGTALRSSASYARTLQVPKEAIRFNVDRLVATNVNEGLRDYYLTEAKRYVNEVFSNARENATNEEIDVLKTLQRLNNTRIPYALRKTNPVMIATPLLNTFYTNALIGIYRTPVEFFNNIISYSLGNRSGKSITMPFTTKEKEQTNNLLSEFQSSVQFEQPDKETRFINKKWYQSSKGVNGLISTQKGHQLLIPMLNNITAFMRKGEWKTQFDRAFENITGEKFNYEKHFVKEKETYFEDMEQAASDADFNVRRIIKGGNKSEQRQFVQWVPFVKKGRVDADSFAASFLGMFSGFIGHDVDNMTIGLRKTIKPGEVKDGVMQFLGAAGRLSLYPTLMLVAKALGKMYFGDDDEKEEGKETLDTLKTPEGLADLSLYTFKQLIATAVMGKYAFGGKVVGNFLLHASYTMTEDRRQRRFIEDTMRELYFTDPIDLKYFNKDDWELQMTANLEPITKMLGEALNDISKDISNKGKEKVTLYDLYEWTQQTEEGKQWMSLASAIVTLGQVTSIALTGTAIPFVDDIVKVAEDYINQKEPNEKTLYKTPSGKQVDMLDLILNDDGMIDINVPGITQRDRDRYSQLATEKFNKSLPVAYNEGFPEDKYAYLKYLRDKAKYDAGKELGYPYEGWSTTEGDIVSTEPIPWFDNDPVPDDEVLLKNLNDDVVKQKQLSFTQNIKEKRKVEDYMFKEIDKDPTLKQDYENAPDGGKLGIREYFKAKYLYDKYKLTEPPIKSDYFNKEGGKIKQVESTSQYGN